MSEPIQVVHLTDFHLLAEPGARLHGWDVQRAFDTVLDDVLQQIPDASAFILGGDLVDDETAAGYARLNQRLATLDRPVLAMAGNHDDPFAMQEQLRCAVVHGALTIGGWQLVALDSHIDGSEAGRIGPEQLDRLDTQLSRSANPTVVFVHHPPRPVGSAWIDAIGLEDSAALAAVIERYAHVGAIVCGHAHQQATLEFAGRPCLVTPATMRQFLPKSETFAEDALQVPGYRVLTLGADQSLQSRVARVALAQRACG